MCKITDIKRKKKRNTIVITVCGDKMTSKREQMESQQNKRRNQMEINMGEARSRDYVYPHRWSDGTKMAGIARKVGPNDSRFFVAH